ncbi:unnamed protein product, partial [marine sediment metagenome]
SNISVIESFVENGGGLFLCSEWGNEGNFMDDLGERFGFFRYNPGMSITDSDDGLPGSDSYIPFDGENIHNHSITLSVNRVEVYSSSGFTTIPDDGNTLVKTDGDGTASRNNTPIAAASTYGNGRVVVIGDSNILTDGDIDVDAVDNWEDSFNTGLH